QGTYWMSYACLVSFAAVLLQAKGFAMGTVGIILAVSNIISVVLQPEVAAAVDRNHKIHLKNVIAGFSAAAVFFCLLLKFCGSSAALVALFFVGASMLHITLQSLVNALGMETIEKGVPINYGLARGMGSVTFAGLTFFLGDLVEQKGVDVLIYGYALLAAVMALLCLLYLVPVQPGYWKARDERGRRSVARALRESRPSLDEEKNKNAQRRKSTGNPVEFFRKYPAFGMALVGMVCMHTSHAFFNNYMIAIAEKCGGGSGVTGICMGIAAFTELPMLVLFNRILQKWKVEQVIPAAGIGFSIKAALALAATSVPMLYAAQFCQLFAYALYLPSLVHFARYSVDVEDMVQGQAYGGIAMSIAGVLGSLGGGFLIDGIGVNGMLAVAVVLPLIGVAVFTVSRRKKA
ncbi:MAG: MFS transporter, partial [Firmicutes bacterium]|nr:MFS transporter [Bacillota bacterium]